MLKSSLPALAVITLISLPAYSQDVTFKKASLKVGDTRTETTENLTDIDVNVVMNGQQVQSGNRKIKEQSEKYTEILAVTDGAPTKVLVKYTKIKRTQETQQNGVEEQSDPLNGKSFILTKDGDSVTVTDENGSAVEDLTADSVRMKEKDAFETDPSKFSKILPDRAIKVGESINVDKDKAAQVFSGSDAEEFKIESMVLVLKETKELEGAKVAVFELTVKGVVETGQGVGPKIEMNLSGQVILGIDTTWPHIFEMAGPLSFKQANGNMTMSAEGKTSNVIKAKYGKKKAASKEKSKDAKKGF